MRLSHSLGSLLEHSAFEPELALNMFFAMPFKSPTSSPPTMSCPEKTFWRAPAMSASDGFLMGPLLVLNSFSIPNLLTLSTYTPVWMRSMRGLCSGPSMQRKMPESSAAIFNQRSLACGAL